MCAQTLKSTEIKRVSFGFLIFLIALCASFVPQAEAAQLEPAAADIASGESGTISWRIDDSWKLTIAPINGVSGEFASGTFGGYGKTPWHLYAEQIKSIEFRDSVGFPYGSSIAQLFAGCDSLESINLSGLNTSNVANMSSMFANLDKLRTLNASGLDTSSVTDMSCLFQSCSSLSAIDLTSWDFSNVQNMSKMFAFCDSLETVNLSGANLSNATDMGSMFRGCDSLKIVNLKNAGVHAAIDLEEMFYGCTALTSLDLSTTNFQNVNNTRGMFYGCLRLETLDVSGLSTQNSTDMFGMFARCRRLTTLKTGANWKQSHMDNLNLVAKFPINMNEDKTSYQEDTIIPDGSRVFKHSHNWSSWGYDHYDDPNYYDWPYYSDADGYYDLYNYAYDYYGSSYSNYYDSYTSEYYHSFDCNPTGYEPSCTEPGEMSRYCPDCGKVQWKTARALGHDWEYNETLRYATFAKTGLQSWYCSRCGEEKTASTPRKAMSAAEKKASQVINNLYKHAKSYNVAKMQKCFSKKQKNTFFNKKSALGKICKAQNKKRMKCTILSGSAGKKKATFKVRVYYRENGDAFYRGLRAYFKQGARNAKGKAAISLASKQNGALVKQIKRSIKKHGFSNTDYTFKINLVKTKKGWKIAKATDNLIDSINCDYKWAYNKARGR